MADENTNMLSLHSLVKLINWGRNAVPEVKYAIGIVAIAAAAFLVAKMSGPEIESKIIFAIFAISGMLILMVLLFAFTKIVKSNSHHISLGGLVIYWCVILSFCAVLLAIVAFLINLKKSVEFNPAENIQHKLDRKMRIMWCV